MYFVTKCLFYFLLVSSMLKFIKGVPKYKDIPCKLLDVKMTFAD